MTRHEAIMLRDGSGSGIGRDGAPRRRRTLWQRIRGFRLELSPLHYVIVFAALTLVAFAPGTARVFVPAEGVAAPALGEAELPGRNFPGSAFFFLDPASMTPLPAPAATDADSTTPGATNEPAARPFVIDRRGPAYARALKCLTDAIYYEAATEPDAGQRAVAQVVLNRVRHPSYPNSVCGVVYQGSDRATGCQFSFSCDGSMARTPAPAFYARAARVAAAALAGDVYAPAGLATHYHTTAVYPYWAPSLRYMGLIGAHRFYRWNGGAGTPAAFFSRYAGAEPNPWPLPRASAAVLATPVADPIALERQFEAVYETARLKALAAADAAARAGQAGGSTGAAATAAVMPSVALAAAPPRPASAPSDPLPAAGPGSIRAEYAGSGSWKAMPGQ